MPSKECVKDIYNPMNKLSIFITQYQCRGGYENRLYCIENPSIKDDNLSSASRKIVTKDIEEMILSVISKNFKKYLWELYYNNKKLKIKGYQEPYYSRYYDTQWYTSEWDGEFKILSQELLDIFGCKYKITKEKLNTVNLPVVDIEITFDIKKAINNLNNYI